MDIEMVTIGTSAMNGVLLILGALLLAVIIIAVTEKLSVSDRCILGEGNAYTVCFCRRYSIENIF